MKVLILSYLLLLSLTFLYAEITPRFPGTQPIIIDGSNTTNNNNGTVTLEIKQDIDLFTEDVDPIIIIFPNVGVPPRITDTQFTTDSVILGGERDIILTAVSGPGQRVLTCSVAQGEFSLAAPSLARGIASIQYDGVDGSAVLNTNPGLGGIDLTINRAIGFGFNALSDNPTNFTLAVYSTGGVSGSIIRQVQGQVISDTYLIPFSEIPNVDFTSVVAIEFSVEAFDNVDFILTSLVTYGDASTEPVGGDITGSVLPCDTDYYRLQTITEVGPEDYLKISFFQQGEPDHPNSLGVFYIVGSTYEDLQTELETNENIVDTLGELPGPNNYLYKCDQAACDIEITCELEALTYYIAVEGNNE